MSASPPNPTTLASEHTQVRQAVKVLNTLNGVILIADRRGHQDFSNVYWKRAPPAVCRREHEYFGLLHQNQAGTPAHAARGAYRAALLPLACGCGPQGSSKLSQFSL